MAVVGILTAAALSGFTSVKTTAKRNQSQLRFRQICEALSQYRTFYNQRPPLFSGTGVVTVTVNIDSTTKTRFLETLEGHATNAPSSAVPSAATPNPKQVRFRIFDSREFVSGNRSNNIVDAFGNTILKVMIRADNQLAIPKTSFPAAIQNLVPTAGVAEEFVMWSEDSINPSRCAVSWL